MKTRLKNEIKLPFPWLEDHVILKFKKENKEMRKCQRCSKQQHTTKYQKVLCGNFEVKNIIINN